MKAWEKVQLSGSFLNDDSMLVRKQYLESKLGFWVITPFQLENNDLILINRGWIPIASSSSAVEEIPKASQGLVKIKGYLQKFNKFEEKPSDLPKNQLNQINYQNFSSDLNKDYYVQLNESFPQDREIAIIPLPELSNGPHLSYAIQWILFALLLPIGWYVLLRNEAK
jgi:cytochrome oxidase assembly protein ShyY1